MGSGFDGAERARVVGGDPGKRGEGGELGAVEVDGVALERGERGGALLVGRPLAHLGLQRHAEAQQQPEHRGVHCFGERATRRRRAAALDAGGKSLEGAALVRVPLEPGQG